MNKKIKAEHIFDFILLLVLCVLIASVLQINDMVISENSPITLPLISVTIAFILLIISFFKEQNFESAQKLLNKDILAIIVFIALYVVILPLLHFRIATLLFLMMSFWYLGFRKIKDNFVLSFIITYWLVLLFEYIFKNILP